MFPRVRLRIGLEIIKNLKKIMAPIAIILHILIFAPNILGFRAKFLETCCLMRGDMLYCSKSVLTAFCRAFSETMTLEINGIFV